MRKHWSFIMGLCAATAFAGTVAADSSSHDGGSNRRELSAFLSGDDEVPGPGDRNGFGEALISLQRNQRRVCFDLSWFDIGRPTMAHIHAGEAGDAGPVVVTLFRTNTPLRGNHRQSCVNGVSRSLIADMQRNPEDYYVNIHNRKYPDGAIRGQLEPSDVFDDIDEDFGDLDGDAILGDLDEDELEDLLDDLSHDDLGDVLDDLGDGDLEDLMDDLDDGDLIVIDDLGDDDPSDEGH